MEVKLNSSSFDYEKTISIIAPNIKNGGGKELLEYLLEHLETNYKDILIVVYLDISLENIKETKNRKVILLSSNIEKIKLFYKKIDNALYFGNLPPLRKSNNSIVYFQNIYLLMSCNKFLQSSVKFFIKYSLQQLYIKIFIKNVDIVACQNENIKKDFMSKYHFQNVMLLPFFRLCDDALNSVYAKVYDFCYVSLAHPHKKHTELIDALDILSNENIPLTLALTIEDGHEELIEKIDKLNERGIVKIDNLGVLSKKDVCKLYAQSKCLVFPSTKETLGLALIESVNMGLDVIAANLDYVYQSIKPSLVFNPNDTNDIAKKLKIYLNGNIIKSETVIDNKIDQLIKILIKE